MCDVPVIIIIIIIIIITFPPFSNLGEISFRKHM